jgi:hypothetical protein
LRCLSALEWIKCQIAIFGTAANLLRPGRFPRQVSYSKSLIYDSAHRRKAPYGAQPPEMPVESCDGTIGVAPAEDRQSTVAAFMGSFAGPN